MNHLLETIERNGEFEKYVEMLADRQEREQRELRRRARELKRLEKGDDYQSSDTEESNLSEEEEDSYGEESYGHEMSKPIESSQSKENLLDTPLLSISPSIAHDTDFKVGTIQDLDIKSS